MTGVTPGARRRSALRQPLEQAGSVARSGGSRFSGYPRIAWWSGRSVAPTSRRSSLGAEPRQTGCRSPAGDRRRMWQRRTSRGITVDDHGHGHGVACARPVALPGATQPILPRDRGSAGRKSDEAPTQAHVTSPPAPRRRTPRRQSRGNTQRPRRASHHPGSTGRAPESRVAGGSRRRGYWPEPPASPAPPNRA